MICAGVGVFLVLTEAGMRAAGYIILSLQDRRNRIAAEKKGSFRILCLGESTTQHQWPPFLDEILNASKAGAPFTVIDKGRAGTTTSTIVSRLEQYLDEYRPHAVAVMMGINDAGGHMPVVLPAAKRPVNAVRSLRIYTLMRYMRMHIAARYGGARAPEQAPAVRPAQLTYQELLDASCGHQSRGEYAQAESLFLRAIDMAPDIDTGYLWLGGLYHAQHKYAHAEKLFLKALGLNPACPDGYYALGLLYQTQDMFGEAEAAFQKAIDAAPWNDGFHFKLAWLYREHGKYRQAEAAFKRAIELNPRSDEAYVGLGGLYHEQKKYIEAEGAFHNAIALEPRSDRAHAALALIYEATGEQARARVYALRRDNARITYLGPSAASNYRRLKDILDRRRIPLVCVQYPMRNVGPLKKLFEHDDNVFFVDNEESFKDAVRQSGLNAVFRDMFAGDFGHCTDTGNRILAQNVAEVLLNRVFPHTYGI